jgi:UDP-N-acetylmuramoyl-tripeptide--D-alanyl-D-alanine ligase
VLVGGDFLKFQHPYPSFESPEAAGEWIKEKAHNAQLLIKGSRSMKMEKLLEFL